MGTWGEEPFEDDQACDWVGFMTDDLIPVLRKHYSKAAMSRAPSVIRAACAHFVGLRGLQGPSLSIHAEAVGIPALLLSFEECVIRYDGMKELLGESAQAILARERDDVRSAMQM